MEKIYGIKKIKSGREQNIIKKSARSLAGIYKTNEFSVVLNPSYIYPKFDLSPLARKSFGCVKRLTGIIKDMDGTTTTTETLCINSLEFMVRKITNRMDKRIWSGLDRIRDYPHIIGNSTTKHIEYLIGKYNKNINFFAFRQAYFYAVLWTISQSKDILRKQEVMKTVSALGCQKLFSEKSLIGFLHGKFNTGKAKKLSQVYNKKYGKHLNIKSSENQVRACIDIYYQRYHEILEQIAAGQSDNLKKTLTSGKRLIEPMPGIDVFLALIKGWLGEDLSGFFPQFKEHLLNHSFLNYSIQKINSNEKYLKAIGRYFQKNPVKVAVVTSSIRYEANIVLNEVFKVIREKIKRWPISKAKKEKIIPNFKDFRKYYNGFVSASDSSEIRLKPHRDLYSLALHQLGIKPDDFDEVLGFEDSESGLLALRAAGVSKNIAVPFQDTQGHDLSSASSCLYGGIPELILIHHLFINI